MGRMLFLSLNNGVKSLKETGILKQPAAVVLLAVVAQTGASSRGVRRPTDMRSTCCRRASTPGSSAADQAHCHAAGVSPHCLQHRRTGPPSAGSAPQHQQLHRLMRTEMQEAWSASVETRGSARTARDVLTTTWRRNNNNNNNNIRVDLI